MLIYHQCGHNFVWNIDSLRGDHAGHGLIISPVNLELDRIADRVPEDVRAASWIDPQFYLPDSAKGKLTSYPFFPSNVMENFTTTDFESCALEVARACLEFQDQLRFRYLVIPTRYFDDLPEHYLAQMESIFVEPFLEAARELRLERPLLLTIIAKSLHIEPGPQRDELLTWATRYGAVAGIYLIFDSDFYSKQIKDPGYLADALRFIHALRENDLEVHIGYAGLEGLLFSVADATSVSVGSYENLRSFGTLRLEIREPAPRRGPQPRNLLGSVAAVDRSYLSAGVAAVDTQLAGPLRWVALQGLPAECRYCLELPAV